MPPDLSWDNIPYELLLNVYRELSYRDLVSCGAVSVHWRHVMRDKILWKRHLKGVYAWWNWEPLVTTSYYDEFMFFKRNIPKFLKEVVNDYDYDLRHCIFSPFGAFFLVCGKGAHFCVYRSDPLEFLHERCLKDSLSWQEITTAQFSPDDSKVQLSFKHLFRTLYF
ncbi:F-box domain protein [Ancylostoma caninum]|uniref:F-box domain protein n=1 Tax=Ancylostoma caninum TaxID=29170 RepID=A0A368GAC3_ANCCA|nr:F-box domain protein [Ancylostoma caninum]